VLGDLDRPRDPDVALAQDQLEQPRHHPHARRPADDLRMAHEVEEAAFLPRALELFFPHLEHVLLAPDAVADGRHGAEAEERPVVQVAVLAHLVTTPHDLTAELGIALDDPARNVPARLYAVAIQHVQDARRAGLRTVGAHGHVQRPLGQRRVAMDPRALPVEIERDGERTSLPLRPPDLPLHAYLLSAINALKLKKSWDDERSRAMVSQLLRSRSTSARRGSDGWAPRAVQASAAAALAKASAAASSR